MSLIRYTKLTALLLMLWAGGVMAQQANYFQTEVVVASQGASERGRAAAVGLERVLVRLSGSRDVAQSAAVKTALSRATRYVEQYQYKQGRDELGARREFMSMSFAPRVIEQLLREANLPYWPTNRPPVLVWLVNDTEAEGRRLVNDRNNNLLAALLEEAQTRGLPLRLPLLDMEDQLAFSAERAWALDEQAVLQASERYNSDVLLMGRYTQDTAGQWLMTWQYYLGGQWQSFDERTQSLSSLVAAVINPVADELAARYAVAPGGAETGLSLAQVSGINSFKDYREALDYLLGLALVDGYQLRSQLGDSLLLELDLNGDLQQLQNALALDGKLYLDAQISPPGPQLMVPPADGGALLRLRWTGGAG